ncbi:MAG: DNA-processing protein DprA [Patescibacteria group bacterium]
MEEKAYAVGFSRITHIGPVRGKRLLDYFGTFEAAWKATSFELQRAGIEEKIAKEVIELRSAIYLEQEMEKLVQTGISVTTLHDEGYPALLKEIANPPFLLYVRGELTLADSISVGIVGSRSATEYGRAVTHSIAHTLAQAGVTVISGLALGIDSVAHSATLEIPTGRTIAVLGSGIDSTSIYPKVNQKLAERIADGRGAVISEYPIGTLPLKHHFPARNRIISGLSLGVVVVEAQITSGSLITAQCALEQNREVFAVPGDIYNKNSQAPHFLLRQGAKLVEKGEDILEELLLQRKE